MSVVFNVRGTGAVRAGRKGLALPTEFLKDSPDIAGFCMVERAILFCELKSFLDVICARVCQRLYQANWMDVGQYNQAMYRAVEQNKSAFGQWEIFYREGSWHVEVPVMEAAD